MEHDTSGHECWCQPTTELQPDGSWLVIHKADDDRELDEMGELEFYFDDL